MTQDDPLGRNDDGLWDLLGEAKSVQVSPFFARNVLREVRLARPGNRGVCSRLLRRWRVALIGGIVVVVVAVNGGVLLHENENNAIAQRDQVANLDEFLAYEPTSGWLDQSMN